MTPEQALSECERAVRRFDADRYFASLFAPRPARPLLFALYAFQHELRRINESVREPMMAEIRLQWWREAVEAAQSGRPPPYPAAIGLAEIFARAAPEPELLHQLIDAYAPDSLPDPYGDTASLERFANSTSAAVMHVAAAVLSLGKPDDTQCPDFSEAIRESGIAFGLATILRSMPFDAMRRNLRDAGKAKDAVRQISIAASRHHSRARELCLPGPVLPAMLPAALVPSYLARAARLRDPLREQITISPLRRQLVLLRAAAFARL